MTTTMHPMPPPSAPPVQPLPDLPEALTTLASVEAWLRSLEPDTICGYAASAGECPLACYLKSTCGISWASVGAFHYHLVSPDWEQRHLMPRWATTFVYGIDALPRRLDRPLACGITAQQALEVLEGVRREGEAGR